MAIKMPKHLTWTASPLKDNGYKTGLVGKFHMGSPYTPQHGFDVWVPDEHGHTTDFSDMHYVENGEVHHYDGHATDFWTDKAIEFVNIARLHWLK
jgi:arylsulfatase A-like enzyme